jgi:hypothetical protein
MTTGRINQVATMGNKGILEWNRLSAGEQISPMKGTPSDNERNLDQMGQAIHRLPGAQLQQFSPRTIITRFKASVVDRRTELPGQEISQKCIDSLPRLTFERSLILRNSPNSLDNMTDRSITYPTHLTKFSYRTSRKRSKAARDAQRQTATASETFRKEQREAR